MWLGRFERPLPIRCRGAFHSYSAREGSSGVRVVVRSDPRFDVVAAPCLDRLAQAHSELGDVSGILKVRERGEFEGRPFVSFQCEVLGGGEALLTRLGETRTTLNHATALTAIDLLSRPLCEAHQRVDSRTSEGFCLGGLLWGNVVVSADGTPIG